jgi:hypothetical protein
MSPVDADRASADRAPGDEEDAEEGVDGEGTGAVADVDAAVAGAVPLTECEVPDDPQPATTATSMVAATTR